MNCCENNIRLLLMVNDARKKKKFTQTKYYRKSASHATRDEIKRRLWRRLREP